MEEQKSLTPRHKGAKEEGNNEEGRKTGRGARTPQTVPAFFSCFPAFLMGPSAFFLGVFAALREVFFSSSVSSVSSVVGLLLHS
jgi:hypothetical protein